MYAVDINFEWSNIHSNGLPEEMYINKYCPEIINGVTVPASFSPPDSLNIHAMFLDGELQYRKSPQTVPVQFNPEAMTLTRWSRILVQTSIRHVIKFVIIHNGDQLSGYLYNCIISISTQTFSSVIASL